MIHMYHMICSIDYSSDMIVGRFYCGFTKMTTHLFSVTNCEKYLFGRDQSCFRATFSKFTFTFFLQYVEPKQPHLDPKNFIGPQWSWWQRYVGDFIMMTDLRCWWQNHYVGDFSSFWWFWGSILSATNIPNRSRLVSSIKSVISSPTFAINIDVASLSESKVHVPFLIQNSNWVWVRLWKFTFSQKPNCGESKMNKWGRLHVNYFCYSHDLLIHD